MQTILLLCLLPLLLSVGAVCPSTCTAQWQCNDCSANYNYVNCTNGVCACLTNQGFTGNATSASPCNCTNTVIYYPTGSSNAYCLNIPFATQLQVNNSLANVLKSQVTEFYTNMIYPTPLYILNKSISLDSLIDPTAVGRIDPLTIIINGSVLIEYFYAFTLQRVFPGGPLASVNQIDVVSLAVDFTGPLPRVLNRIRVHFAVGGTNVFNYTIGGTFTFGADNRILKLDQGINNVGWITDPKLNNRTAYAVNFCNQYATTCNATYDPTGYYTDFNDCFDFVTNHVRNTTWNGKIGNLEVTYDQPAGNTSICRQMHLNMAPYDPFIHCPHAGKTGGMFCTDAANGLFGPNPGPYYANYDSNAQQFS